MSRAVVDLRVDRPVRPGLVQAAASLRSLARVQAGAGPDAVAVLATSVAATAGCESPVAAWYEEGDDVAGFRGLLLHEPEVEPPPGARSVSVVDGVDLTARHALSPFLRSRWRIRVGLPQDLVVRLGPEGCMVLGGAAVPPAAVEAAVALAAAVVVDPGGRLIDALAWGSPCVTDPASAASAEAVADVHLRVASSATAMEGTARALAADWMAATSLGRSARRLVELRWDRSAWAGRLAAHLLGRRDHLAACRLDAALASLRTPRDAAIVHGALASVAGWA